MHTSSLRCAGIALLAALVLPALAQAEEDFAAAQALYDHGDAVRNVPACAGCHGPAGVSSNVHAPSLAGQLETYLAKQLRDFQAGQRRNPVMAPVAALLAPEDIARLAAYLATKPGPAGWQVTDPAAARLGERVFLQGIPERHVPACAGCHGMQGQGAPGPRLAGQSAEYQAAQLLGFRDGRRGNGPLMVEVARHLGDDEIQALATYMAGMGKP